MKDNRLISNPIHALSQDEEETVIIVPLANVTKKIIF